MPDAFMRNTTETAVVFSIWLRPSSMSSIMLRIKAGSSFFRLLSLRSPLTLALTSTMPTCPASNSLLYCFILMTGDSPSGAIPKRSMFSSTLTRPMVPERRINKMNPPITIRFRLTGKSTMVSNAFSGGCFGFLRSSKRVKLGTMNIVKM